MGNFKITLNCKAVSTHVLLTVLLTGCTTNTSHYFSNSPSPAMKMKHHTTILSAETHQLVDSTIESSSEVNFEYQEITTQ